MVGSDAEQRAQREAADWFGRLRSRSVTTDELADFAAWRGEAINRRAYERMEALWNDAAAVRDDPEIEDAIRDALRPSSLRHRLVSLVTDRAALTIASSLVGAGVAAFLFLSFTPSSNPGYQTGIGERSVVKLSDGTSIDLDTNSLLTPRFSNSDRRVDLSRGQAYFDVHHDPRHPFVVDIGNGATVTALGTRFDVSKDADTATIALYEGSVAVASARGGTAVTLSPGQAVVVASGIVGNVAGLAGTGRPTWITGRLSFRDTPLDAAVAQVNRYTTRPLRVARSEYSHQPVSGDFASDDPDGFAAAANAIFGAGVVTRDAR